MSEEHDDLSELAAALVAAQGEMTHASKDAENPHFKSGYASLQSVYDAVRPVFAKHGLAVVQYVHGRYLISMLLHKSGQRIVSQAELPDSQGNPQKDGSAITYFRRYVLMGMAGIAPADDDDGNKAAEQPKPQGPPAGNTLATKKQLELIRVKCAARAKDYAEAGIAPEDIANSVKKMLGLASFTDELKRNHVDNALMLIEKWEPGTEPAEGEGF